MNSTDKDLTISLPKFLKLLTSNGVTMQKAMAVAGKVYKECNTLAALAQMTEATLDSLGVETKEDRKLVMSALQKAGCTPKGTPRKTARLSSSTEASQYHSPAKKNSSTSASSSNAITVSTPRKRKRPNNSNEFLSEEPKDEAESNGDFQFYEVIDEEILETKSTIINRAPVMMAWAMLVAECMHFTREEALSIASVYTEMNALSKGVSLGIYDRDKDRGSEAAIGGSQPYVELMARRIPLYRTQKGQWRALSNGKPIGPADAFSYITHSFRQTSPYIIGALKLLAQSYSVDELKGKAWSLYAEFRPEVNEWGKRSQIQCLTILELRKKAAEFGNPNMATKRDTKPSILDEKEKCVEQTTVVSKGEPQMKKARLATVEEYEAFLDQDTTFNDVDLDSLSMSAIHSTP